MADWVDRRTAAKLIGTNVYHFATAWYRGELPAVLEHKPAELAGLPKRGGPNPLGYWREDCERLGRIRKRCRLPLAQACKVLSAIEKDGPL